MSRRSLWRRLGRAAKDASFILGAVMVAGFILMAVIGPEIAPRNPYLRDSLQYIDGELQRAPIEPGAQYPLGTDAQGRDMLSLLLYGARTTLTLAIIATSVRLLLGLVLGSLTGWWSHSVLDRAVNALSELLAALPALILAMIVVFAVGIRRGQIAFVIALSVVGWGEVAQIVRSHVLSMQQKQFVEAARAVGLSPLQILSRHIMPNLLATMLALAPLEVGAALLLLGELGFVSVFLGGGGIIAGDVGTPSTVIFETPDWGAMLGTSWRSFRAIPWLPALPALAFFLSILSFNLLGYGLQRFVEKGRFYPSGWSVLRFFAVAGVVLWGAQWVLARTSPEQAFEQQVEAFDVSRAWADIAELTRPELQGRHPGSDGALLAASYIARQFEAQELTPFPRGSYFQPFSALHGTVTQEPVLELFSPEGDLLLTLSEGITYDPLQPFDGTGTLEGELVIFGRTFPFANTDSGQVIMFAEGEGGVVVLRIVPPEIIPQRTGAPVFTGPTAFLGDEPALLISTEMAAQVLNLLGYDLEALQELSGDTEGVRVETGVRLRLRYGVEYEERPSLNVVGYIPGTDIRVQNDRILVTAVFTGPEPRAGLAYPGADENASGVAVMLEVLRLWREQDFAPDRTVVFAALDEVGGQHLVQNPIVPADASEAWTAVVIQGVGAGQGRLARLDSGGGLEGAFDQSARRLGVRTTSLESFDFFFTGTGGRGWEIPGNESYTGLAMTWPGDEYSGTPEDTRQHLDPSKLEAAGRLLAHFLMVLSSR